MIGIFSIPPPNPPTVEMPIITAISIYPRNSLKKKKRNTNYIKKMNRPQIIMLTKKFCITEM